MARSSTSSRADNATRTLVVGYGNTLRGDDGVGVRVAEAVESMALPGVHTLVCQQLAPEFAEPIARSDRVIFVDASVEQNADTVELRPIAASDSSQLMAHAADPQTMLALARDVFGGTPEAWWLTIPARDLSFGERFSTEAASGFDRALAEIATLCSG
jgi:hydrogenase maturation protease